MTWGDDISPSSILEAFLICSFTVFTKLCRSASFSFCVGKNNSRTYSSSTSGLLR
ncbi:hypothetical protein HanRHA438_Chr06g0259781 [Helianthus annuus]|nr:hypothetical protein HanRHA438_Chr06g0259781 [Helianthus annuus]